MPFIVTELLPAVTQKRIELSAAELISAKAVALSMRSSTVRESNG